jgi:hypothetical protein
MSDHSGAEVVVSGVPYTVTAVNGRAPASLDDFAGDIVEVAIARGDQRLMVRGTSRVDHDSVVIHEKTFDGAGKDVRTWHVSVEADGFQATERSMY